MIQFLNILKSTLAREIGGLDKSDEEGQGLVEYALIIFLVAIVVIAILVILGPQIGSVFSAITKGLGT